MCQKPTSSNEVRDKKKPYDHSPCDGCYLNHIRVHRTSDGKLIKPKCKSYSCEKHGWMHAKRLQEAIQQKVESWQKVRFWTFTLTNRLSKTPEEHSKSLSKSWRYFVTELRRNKLLSERERNVSYIKVSESHKSGYLHYHVFFSEYIHYSKIKALWEYATSTVFDYLGKLGSVDVRGNLDAKTCSKYVTKYVVKQAKRKLKYANLYSCSGNEALFEKVEKTEHYAVYHIRLRKWVGLRDPRPCLDNSSKDRHKLSADELFEMSISEKMHPPDDAKQK